MKKLDRHRERRLSSAAQAAESMREALAGEHLAYEQMELYVEGRKSEAVEQHVAICAMCAAEIDDLRGVVAPARSWLAWAAAAAIALAVFGSLWLSRRPETPDRPPRVIARPPESPLASLTPAQLQTLEALRAGQVPGAELARELAGDVERIRGNDDDATTIAPLAPIGVIEETTPLFRWTARRNATFIVEVFDASYRRVARSGALTARQWQPATPLPRGAIYSWQITIDGTTTAPEPPAPPARFKIIDDGAARELADARERGSHLAAALVYAREGMLARASAEMALAQKKHRLPAIDSAAETLRAYQPAPMTTNPPQ